MVIFEGDVPVSKESKYNFMKAIIYRTDCFIPNCNVDHAIYLTELLIRRTNDSGKIDIFTGHLCESIYEDERVLNALDNAKKRNVKIRMILDCDLTKKEKILCETYNLKPRKLIKSTQKQKKHKFNYFLVSDNIASRVERRSKKPYIYDLLGGTFKRTWSEADVNFNNEEQAKLYSNLFNKTLLVNSEMNVLKKN